MSIGAVSLFKSLGSARPFFVAFVLVVSLHGIHAVAAALPTIAGNDNTLAASTLGRSWLAVPLVARDGLWYPDGPGTIGVPIGAFGEVGKPPALPGPLLRVSGSVITS